jgi:two-component system phosphate regulon sensor histidine kinase PhoR
LIIIRDGEGQILRANKALADRLGTTPEEVPNLACETPIAGAATPVLLRCDVDLPADTGEFSTEVSDETLGGVFDLRVSPLRERNGRLMGAVHVARDITALKSMERARRSAVDHLSHELKTPLTIIKGSVKDMESDDLPKPTRLAKVNRIRRALDRLTDIQHIVQEIVAPHRYEPAPFPVDYTTNAALEALREKSAHRSVDLLSYVEPIETDIIDPVVFKEAINTLVKNAIENSPDESEITVYLSQKDGEVLLRVEDRGVGIPSSDREFVFEAFHHTQDTELYSTRRPFDFDAGGKGLELMRLKILSEEGAFDVSFSSRRCLYIPTNLDRCPGIISVCPHITDPQDCKRSGGTTFSVLFHGRPKFRFGF